MERDDPPMLHNLVEQRAEHFHEEDEDAGG